MTYIQTGFARGVGAGVAVLGFLIVLLALVFVAGIIGNIIEITAGKDDDDE